MSWGDYNALARKLELALLKKAVAESELSQAGARIAELEADQTTRLQLSLQVQALQTRIAQIVAELRRWQASDDAWTRDPMESFGGHAFDEGTILGRRQRAGMLAVALGLQACACESWVPRGGRCKQCGREGTREP